MQIRIASEKHGVFETAMVTYPPAGLILPGDNSSSSRIERCDVCAGTTRRQAAGFGDRLLGFCCECLARICEMYAASEAAGVDAVTKSRERSLERIPDDESWASVDA